MMNVYTLHEQIATLNKNVEHIAPLEIVCSDIPNELNTSGNSVASPSPINANTNPIPWKPILLIVAAGAIFAYLLIQSRKRNYTDEELKNQPRYH
ncbi:hypothetical protein ACFLRQ_03070 [Bacteroidota bacterium]